MAGRVEWTFDVGGMSCGHCAGAVDEALREVPGVLEAATRHAEGKAVVVAEDRVDVAALAVAIEDAGYKVLARSSRRLA